MQLLVLAALLTQALTWTPMLSSPSLSFYDGNTVRLSVISASLPCGHYVKEVEGAALPDVVWTVTRLQSMEFQIDAAFEPSTVTQLPDNMEMCTVWCSMTEQASSDPACFSFTRDQLTYERSQMSWYWGVVLTALVLLCIIMCAALCACLVGTCRPCKDSPAECGVSGSSCLDICCAEGTYEGLRSL